MEITNKTRRQLRIQAWTFIILFLTVIGLLGWISTRYNKQLDWTATGRHTLTEASAKVLEKLERIYGTKQHRNIMALKAQSV